MTYDDWRAKLGVAIRYAGSDAGAMASAQLLAALRELDQLRALHAPFAVTADEMSSAWYDTHNREGQEPTREALNAILANRQKHHLMQPAASERDHDTCARCGNGVQNPGRDELCFECEEIVAEALTAASAAPKAEERGGATAVCPRCSGAGRVPSGDMGDIPCLSCLGTGYPSGAGHHLDTEKTNDR